LKEELEMIVPELEEMQKRKHDRRNQFIEVQEQIQSISNEIHGAREIIPFIVDDTDLSLRKLEELHRQLHTLQKEKVNDLFLSPPSLSLYLSLSLSLLLNAIILFLMQSDRLKKLQDNLYSLSSLCSVLGLDFKQTVSEVHPSLGNSEGSKSVNNDTINQLALAIQELRGVKLQRMQKVWNITLFYNFICDFSSG
jgi:protein regulator of cytokinesis 1